MEGKKLQVHKEGKTKYVEWISGRYYDHPDGQDLIGKLYFTTKVAASAGTVIGAANLKMAPKPTTFSAKVIRVTQGVVPCVAMAAIFTTVTYYSTVIRKKDDPFNYVLGGAAAGLVMAPAMGVPALFFFGPVSCAAIGFVKKYLQLRNKTFLPSIIQEDFSSYVLRNWDTTLLPDTRRGNWTKEPPPK